MAANLVADVAGNGNSEATQFIIESDRTPAEVTDIIFKQNDLLDPAAFNASPIQFAFTHTENDIFTGPGTDPNNYDLDKISITPMPSESPQLVDVDGVMLIQFTPAQDVSGDLAVTLNEGFLTDNASNKSVNSYTESFTFDAIPPELGIFDPTTLAPVTATNSQEPFSILIASDEKIGSLDENLFSASNASIQDIEDQSNASLFFYGATITPNADNTEDITILVAEGAVTDTVGNAISATSFLISYDVTPPVPTFPDFPTETQNSLDPINFTLTFSEGVSGFDPADELSAENGNLEFLSAAADGKTFDYKATPISEGTLTVTVPAEVALDSAGNSNTTGAAAVEINLPPTLNITGVPDFTNADGFEATITFNEAVTGFEEGDITVTNASIQLFEGSGLNYTATILPKNGINDNESISLNIAAGAALDAGGLSNTVGKMTTTAFDGTAPLITFQNVPETIESREAFPVTFTFSEAVTGFEQSDITVSKGTLSDFTNDATDPNKYTVQVTPDGGILKGESVTISVVADAAADAAGNGNSSTEANVTFTLKYGGGSGTAEDPYLIETQADLRELSDSYEDWDKHFMQMADIKMSSEPFLQIGGRKISDELVDDDDIIFSGVYDGGGHVIKDLNLTDVSTNNLLFSTRGLFGSVDVGSLIKNIGVLNVNIKEGAFLARFTGGLVGANSGTIINSYATSTFNESLSAGGFVGYNSGTIINSYAATMINGGQEHNGGLVGHNAGTITNSYASGTVNGKQNIGGVGGLVGLNLGSITNSYATCAVTVENSTEQNSTGGLVGSNTAISGSTTGNSTNSFWDTETSGQATSAGGTGKTSAEMRGLATYISSGWDFKGEAANGSEDIWSYKFYYPLLSWQIDNLQPFTVSGKAVDENGGVFTAGSVKVGSQKAVPLAADGSFSVDVPKGTHFLSIVPTDADSYYSTYYGNTNNLFASRWVFHDQSNIEIQMIAKSQASQLDGNGRVSGRVVSDGSGNGRVVQGRILDGDPIEGVTVFLVRTSDEEIMTSVVTDANGDFEISGIPAGEYQLVLDVAGVDLNLEGSTFTMDEEGSDLAISAAVGEDGVSFTIEEVLGVEDEIEVTVYPNPVVDLLNVRVDGVAQLRVIDLSGHVLKEVAFTNETQVDVRDLVGGVHFIEITNEKGRSVRKLVKNN